MIPSILNPGDPPERQIAKLLTIAQVLMRRVEQDTDDSGAAYAQFQRAAMLEDQVRQRTRDLERALDLLNESNARLALANRSAEAARQNLASAIETIQEGFALFDAEERLVLFNSRFGMHMDDIRPKLRPGISFDDYVDVVAQSGHLALPRDTSPDDWAARRKRRHLDRHVIFNVAVAGDHWMQVSEHRTSDGGTVILQTDVTDIIRNERQERGKLLDDQARMIRATLDHITQGVSIFDAEARLVGWNDRLGKLLTLPLGRVRRGISFETLIDRFQTMFAFSDGTTQGEVLAWAHGAGRRQPISFELRREGQILAVFGQEMPDTGFVLSFTDVTSERAAIEAMAQANETLEARVMERTLELEDALARAERAIASRSRFVAAASHDLLQPLSAAKLFISSIDDAGLGPAVRESLEKTQNALLSVEGILGALLDISKLESGRAAVSVGPVHLGRMLTQLRDEFGAIAAAKGLGLSFRALDVTVQSDATYLRRILQNLIGNAIRYTTKGRVLVAARLRAGAVRLEVWDTGPGIPEEEQDNIFKEFHRLNARASASEGMGLGLAIVERAAALLGHPLGVSSRLGSGSCFLLQVPLAGEGAEVAPLAATPMQATTRRRFTNRIGFVVENDEDLRRALCLLLEKWGISVLDAANAEDALSLIEELGILPDFFLVDQQLGAGMTGIAFILRLRRLHGDIPARLVTANRNPEVAAEADAHNVRMMMKPIDSRALESFLSSL